MASAFHTDAPSTTPDTDGIVVLTLKWLVYGVATLLFLRTLASVWAMGAALGALGLGIAAAAVAHRVRLRLWLGLVLAAGIAGLGFGLERVLLDLTTGPDVRTTLLLADAVYFGMLALGVVFALRLLAARYRFFSTLEVAYVLGSVAYTFAHHRNKMIHRPRWLSDWAWSNGMDPQVILQAVGVVAVLAAVFMLLRYQRVVKLVISLTVLLLLGWLLYELSKGVAIEVEVDTNGLGLTGDEQAKDGDKGGGGGGAGDSKDPFSGPSSPPDVVVPVAIATLHDDYIPAGGIYYFRQQVLSRYDGHHLSPVTDGAYDGDVITEFPHAETLVAEPTQNEAFHVRVPTSMFLLVDHPQPLALTHSTIIEPLENPNPRYFVAAYTAIVQAMDLDVSRLVGRRSVPDTWSPEKRAHYTQLPDDPRYRALSDIIVRDVDPRFEGDELFKALLIKRYLEKNGFYTRKERHADDVDPAASFLFGSMRGYCVHFAHSAVYLFRSQGIPARVALGYAVDTQYRSGGSTLMILNDRAHAWPEIHVDGVGWVTFDIYPEQSDEPPGRIVDQDLESVLGELARRDKTGGRAADPDAEPFRMPWGALGLGLMGLLAAALVASYAIKLGRLAAPLLPSRTRRQQRLYRAALDGFGDLGYGRRFGETRERFATRLTPLAPSLAPLTTAHLRCALGDPARADAGEVRRLVRTVRRELAERLPWWQRAAAWLNPVGWLWTR